MAEANVVQHREWKPDGFVSSGPLTAICRIFLLSIHLREILIYFENLQSLVFNWNKKRRGKIESFFFPFLMKGTSSLANWLNMGPISVWPYYPIHLTHSSSAKKAWIWHPLAHVPTTPPSQEAEADFISKTSLVIKTQAIALIITWKRPQ